MNPSFAEQVAAAAARLVVEEGLEYPAAKRKAARGVARRPARGNELPSNDAVEAEVRSYLELFCADTQPRELRALRELAAQWMQRLAEFRPHLGGAVWRGTATRRSAIVIDLYCDDPKGAEIAIINFGLAYDSSGDAADGNASVLTLTSPCPALGERVAVHLVVRDFAELRGALRADASGRTWRGDLAALQRLLAEEAS